MQKFLKSKTNERLLKVVGGKIFTEPAMVIKLNITASFLDCIDTDGNEQLVYLVYTKTGEYSERNDFYVIEGDFDGLFPKPGEKTVPKADEYEALASVAIDNVPTRETSITSTSDEVINNLSNVEEVLHDTHRNN